MNKLEIYIFAVTKQKNYHEKNYRIIWCRYER